MRQYRRCPVSYVFSTYIIVGVTLSLSTGLFVKQNYFSRIDYCWARKVEMKTNQGGQMSVY
jgi:hypothetical protein